MDVDDAAMVQTLQDQDLVRDLLGPVRTPGFVSALDIVNNLGSAEDSVGDAVHKPDFAVPSFAQHSRRYVSLEETHVVRSTKW